jgi:hypothetical protein
MVGGDGPGSVVSVVAGDGRVMSGDGPVMSGDRPVGVQHMHGQEPDGDRRRDQKPGEQGESPRSRGAHILSDGE